MKFIEAFKLACAICAIPGYTACVLGSPDKTNSIIVDHDGSCVTLTSSKDLKDFVASLEAK